MIRRTPQEIADFFGCYVAQDEDDAGRYFHAFSERPTLTTDEDFGIRNVWCTPGKPDCVNWFISLECVEVPEGHDYHILYEPHPAYANAYETHEERMENARITHDTPHPDNKPDHASEVYTHKGYQLVYSDTPAGLSDAVTKLIGRGWSLYDSPFAMPYGAEFYHYQAMTRGLQ